MNRIEAEEKWDRTDERGHAKWGELTRADRNALTGKRRSLDAKARGGDGEEADPPAVAPRLGDA